MVKIKSLFMINFLTSFRYKINFVISALSLLVPVLPALFLVQNGNISIFGFNTTLDYAVYLLIVTTIWSGVEVLWSFVFQMRNQMKEGIINETLMMPLKTIDLIIGWTLDGVISTVFQSLILIVVIIPIVAYNFSFFQISLSLILILFTYFSSYCFSTILIAIMMTYKETDQIVSFIGNIAPFICGVIVPLKYIPSAIKYFGLFFPFTWSIDIIRNILFNTVCLLPIKIEITILFISTIIYYILGKRLFNVLYQKSRKKGGVVGF